MKKHGKLGVSYNLNNTQVAMLDVFFFTSYYLLTSICCHSIYLLI